MATQIDLGAVVPIGKGDWNSSTTYERANIVRHNSTAWVCKVATSKGVEPSESSSDWYLLVKDMSAVTSINGMRGDVTVDSILTNPSADDSSLKIASTSWVKTKVDNAFKAGLPLGHIYLWPFSTPPDGSIQLNGSTYSRTLYSDLWNLIQSKGWYKPESEWQSIASANGGYCPWYSDGDGSTTFRTPKFAPYQKIALASGDAGKYYEAGLPNILGFINTDSTYGGDFFTSSSGSFSNSLEPTGWRASTRQSTVTGASSQVTFDASRFNPIYGNSTTVQPESHDWIICAVAFGKATNVGEVDVVNVMNAVSQVQAEVTDAKEIDSSGYSSSQHWVRYKDGRQIIYSDWSDNIYDGTITFIKPFITRPGIIGFDNENISASIERRGKFSKITRTYFTTQDWAYGSPSKSGCWVAMGTWK